MYIPKMTELSEAIAAIVLDKAGQKKEAQEFVASLKEHLTKTDEMCIRDRKKVVYDKTVTVRVSFL